MNGEHSSNGRREGTPQSLSPGRGIPFSVVDPTLLPPGRSPSGEEQQRSGWSFVDQLKALAQGGRGLAKADGRLLKTLETLKDSGAKEDVFPPGVDSRRGKAHPCNQNPPLTREERYLQREARKEAMLNPCTTEQPSLKDHEDMIESEKLIHDEKCESSCPTSKECEALDNGMHEKVDFSESVVNTNILADSDNIKIPQGLGVFKSEFDPVDEKLCHLAEFQNSAEDTISLDFQPSCMLGESSPISPIFGPERPPEWCHVRSSGSGACLMTPEKLVVAEEAASGPAVASSVHEDRSEQGTPPPLKFCKVHVPKNLKEAKASEQWEYWYQAMVEEKASLDSHDTMPYVERPYGQKVIRVHWIYSAKVDEFGNVTRFKARLVAQGCRQIPGVDVDEVFAPTSSFGARRALLAVAAAKDYEIHQVDIKTAFLNGELEEDVYVTQPPGFENGNTRVVCKLNKALYGLKQSPRAWHKALDAHLCKQGFVPTKSDAGVYVKKVPGQDPVYIPVYVDDLLIIAKTLLPVDEVKAGLKSQFSVHDLGEVKDFLGCQIKRDRRAKKLFMSSTPKIETLAEKFGVDGSGRVVDTPMSKDFCPTQASVSDNEKTVGAGVPLEPGHRYHELIGSLLYIANTTRPDIAQSVGVLSRYINSPTTAHWSAAIRVLKYLYGSREKALVLGGNQDVILEGYVDADYAGDLDSRYSTSGHLFRVFGGTVSWASKKQKSVATSTVEAEFMASSQAIKEAAWLRGFLEELDVAPWMVKLHCDNQGCILNLKNPVNSKYTKHIAVQFHYAREAIKKGQVDVRHVDSASNTADILTKPLVPPVFRRHVEGLGVLPVSCT